MTKISLFVDLIEHQLVQMALTALEDLEVPFDEAGDFLAEALVEMVLKTSTCMTPFESLREKVSERIMSKRADKRVKEIRAQFALTHMIPLEELRENLIVRNREFEAVMTRAIRKEA